jgi:hypothetical protein
MFKIYCEHTKCIKCKCIYLENYITLKDKSLRGVNSWGVVDFKSCINDNYALYTRGQQ